MDKRRENLIFQRLPKTDDNEERYLFVSLRNIARAFYSSFGKVPNEVTRSFGKFLIN